MQCEYHAQNTNHNRLNELTCLCRINYHLLCIYIVCLAFCSHVCTGTCTNCSCVKTGSTCVSIAFPSIMEAALTDPTHVPPSKVLVLVLPFPPPLPFKALLQPLLISLPSLSTLVTPINPCQPLSAPPLLSLPRCVPSLL